MREINIYIYTNYYIHVKIIKHYNYIQNKRQFEPVYNFHTTPMNQHASNKHVANHNHHKNDNTLRVSDFKHNPITGIFSVTLPGGRVVREKNPFTLQSKVLMGASEKTRAQVADVMTDVTMKWSSCTTPALQDAADDAIDDDKKRTYMESAKIICPVRNEIPTPKIDIIRGKCMTPKDTLLWLLEMENADKSNAVRNAGLSNHIYYEYETGRLNTAGKKAVSKLSDDQRKSLKKWFRRSASDVDAWAIKHCLNEKEAKHYITTHKPLQGVHRVCVHNLKNVYQNQALSFIETIHDHDKLEKGRLVILISMTVIFVVVVIIVVVAIVLKNRKRAKETILENTVTHAHNTDFAQATVKPSQRSDVNLMSVDQTSSLLNDSMDNEIDNLAMEL